MKSYEHLEGKIIDWRSPLYKGGEVFKVKVAGIDPDIGITLVNAEDPDDYFTCVNGPMSPQGKNLPSHLYVGWEAKFTRRARAIEAGFYDVEELYAADGKSLGYGGACPDADNCSFL